MKCVAKICQELNKPKLPNVKRWSGHRGQWKCAVSQVAGRMFRVRGFNFNFKHLLRGIILFLLYTLIVSNPLSFIHTAEQPTLFYTPCFVCVSECGVQWGFDVCFRVWSTVGSWCMFQSVEYSGFLMYVAVWSTVGLWCMFQCGVQWVHDVCFSVEYSGFVIMFQCGVQWVHDVCFSVEYSGFVMYVSVWSTVGLWCCLRVWSTVSSRRISECGVQWVCDVHVLECGEQWVHDVCFWGWSTVGLRCTCLRIRVWSTLGLWCTYFRVWSTVGSWCTFQSVEYSGLMMYLFQSVEYNGFLYDSSQKIELLSASLLEKAEENGKPPFARMPYMGFFRVRLSGSLELHTHSLSLALSLTHTHTHT